MPGHRFTAVLAALLLLGCGASTPSATPIETSATAAAVAQATGTATATRSPTPTALPTPIPTTTATPRRSTSTATPTAVSVAVTWDGQTCTYAGQTDIPAGQPLSYADQYAVGPRGVKRRGPPRTTRCRRHDMGADEGIRRAVATPPRVRRPGLGLPPRGRSGRGRGHVAAAANTGGTLTVVITAASTS